jgi:glycosyltransferase involved in cell wall biosynthesis
VGGITSQIIDKQTGFYLTDDITNNCQSIREVIEHPDRFSKVAQSAHQRVKDKFVLPVMLDDYISVYKKALLS